MKYCECDKGWDVLKLRPFLHVRVVTTDFKQPVYLRDVNALVRAATKRCWDISSTRKAGAYIFHSLAEAKRALKGPKIRSYWPDGRAEISCRHCDGVVWPKDVLVQLAEQHDDL